MILRLSSGGAPGRDSTLCANSTNDFTVYITKGWTLVKHVQVHHMH